MELMGSQWGAECGMRGALCRRWRALQRVGGTGPLLSGCTPDPLEQPGGRVWLPHPGCLLQLSQGATSPAGDSLSQEGWGRLGLPQGFSQQGLRQQDSLGNVPWPLLFPHPCPSASPHRGAVPGKWAGLDPPH